MTQPNLLELARQGNAEAIAGLMNLTLEPRGVIASATLEHDCLQVFLSSTRTLNQQTLVGFVQKGLASLGVPSIQTVRIYGQKMGQDMPIWVAELPLHSPAPSVPVSTVQVEEPPHRKQSIAPQTNTHKLTKTFGSLRRYLDHWRLLVEQSLPPIRDRLQFSTKVLQVRSHQMASRLRRSKNLLHPQRGYTYSLVKLAIVTLPAAFLLGGLVAVIDSYAKSTARQSSGIHSSANGDNSQLSIKSEAELAILDQQAEAKKYLAKMNKAQQNFYFKNGRFAANLEELERSTDLISLTSEKQNYIYRLNAVDESQAQLTAVPKAGGLKSFTGVVFLSLAEDGSELPTTLICESKQPSSTSPSIPKAADSPIKCPANASKVP